MGCVFHYKEKEFETKAALAEYMIQEENGVAEKALESARVTEGKAFDLKRRRILNSQQEEFNKWYKRLNIQEYVDQRDEAFSFNEPSTEFSNFDTLVKSIKKMNGMFDAVVIMNGSINTLGELLPADHPLSLEKGKPVILINPKIADSETVFHEFSHLYIDLLGGTSHPLVTNAIELLKETSLYSKIQEEYPELSEEMLNREVLAQAMGEEVDSLFGKELVPMSAFSKIVSSIYDIISRLLGINKSAVRDLATQLITDSTKESPEATYNTLIAQKQKIKVDGTKRAEVIKLIEFFKSNNEVVQELEDGSGRGYNIGKGVDKISTNDSATGLTKSNRTLKSDAGQDIKSKGDINLKFKKEEYNSENFKFKLSQRKIPMALNRALNTFLESKNKFDNTTKTWHALLTRPTEIDGSESGNANPALDLISGLDENYVEDPQYASVFEFLIANLDKILVNAAEYQEEQDLASFAGTLAHDAVEKFVLTGVWPKNISFDDFDFKNYIEKLISDGRAAGSTFYTEVSIYSALNKLAGTIDLLEIKADGTFVVHDYKTTRTFNYTSDNAEIRKKVLSNEQLFIDKGYAAQLMIYGRILEESGLIPSSVPFNLIASKIGYQKLDVRKTETFSLSGLRTFSFEKGNSKQKRGIDAKLYGIYNEVYNTLRGRQLEIREGKVEFAEYKKILEKIKKDVILYKKLRKKNAKNIDDGDIDSMSTLLTQIDELKTRAEQERVSMSIQGVIKSAVLQMAVLEQEKKNYNTNTFPSEYLHSYKYIMQLLNNLKEIQIVMEADEDNSLKMKDQDKLLEEVNKLVANIESSKDYYKKQVTKHAIIQLAIHSYLQYGVHKESFQMLLKNKGVSNKKERDLKIEKMLFENGDEIRNKEMEYWKSAFDDGILDLRMVEHLFMDPGTNKSQVVQIVKNMMDISDTEARLDIDRVIPDIVKMHKETAFNGSGNTQQVYAEILEYREVVGIDGVKIKDLNGSLIPEFTSDNREYMFKYITQRDHYLDLRKEINFKKVKSNKDKADLIKIDEAIEALRETYVKRRDDLSIKKKRRGFVDQSRILRENPEFTKLSEAKKAELRKMHEFQRMADAQIVTNDSLRLVKYFDNPEDRSDIPGKGEYIYSLAKMRMGNAEVLGYGNKVFSRITSAAKELSSQAADADGETISDENNDQNLENEEEKYTGFDGAMSDLNDKEVYDVPVRYRNSLGSDRDLQSYDIPTLLSMNYDTSTFYKARKSIEPDLFMVMEAIKGAKIIKTDAFRSEAVKGDLGRDRLSDRNLIYDSIEHQINNRLYSKKYSGVHSKAGYRIIKAIEVVKSFTSVMTLSGNFMSALTTGGQGSIYRLMEGFVGEFYDINDWRKGTVKAHKDVYEVLKDTQKPFPTSKTMLLIKMLGLENHQKSLSNKFIEKNVLTKNLDQGTLFAMTSSVESLVTSTLMYSLLSNVKMLNTNGEYIDQDGKVVDRENAMTFDEAYTVEKGKLTLNKHVSHTSKDFSSKYVERDGSLNMLQLTNISNGVKAVYADMYGQYNENMKSYFERTIYGSVMMSMKKWAPRGAHRRFRGMTEQLRLGKNFKDFEEGRKVENINYRFFSQDHQGFQEGYYTTTAKFTRIVLRDLRKAGGLIASYHATRATMTDHENANLKRGVYDLIQMSVMSGISSLIYSILAGLKLDDDEETSLTQERLYFIMYLALRIKDESQSFLNPRAMFRTITDPPVVGGTISNITGLLTQLLWMSEDEDGTLGLSIDDSYESGNNEGKNKAFEKGKAALIPGYKNAQKILGLTGISEDPSYTVEDSYKGYVRNR